MQFIIGILAFVLMLSFIVIVHELGHFVAARCFGVYCHEFSIGMGPLIWSRQGKHTKFSIRAIPLGGYVTMAGEQDGVQDLDEKDVKENEDQDSEEDWLKNVPAEERLDNKPTWQKIIIMLAGVFMNMVLAFLIFFGLFLHQGVITLPSEPIVETIEEGSPAAVAGLKKNDKILKIQSQDGTVIEPQTVGEVSEFLQFNPGSSTYTIERDGQTIQTEMTPVQDKEAKLYYLGFSVPKKVQQIGFLGAIQASFEKVGENIFLIFTTLGQLIQGKGIDQLSGPIGIYKVTDTVVSLGIVPYLSLIAMISVNIGIFNLLPIPALDGGRVVLLLLEKVFRRKIPMKVLEVIMIGSFVLLIGLMLFATYNDVIRSAFS